MAEDRVQNYAQGKVKNYMGGDEDIGRDFGFDDAATTDMYSLSLHVALPMWAKVGPWRPPGSAKMR